MAIRYILQPARKKRAYYSGTLKTYFYKRVDRKGGEELCHLDNNRMTR